MSTFSSRDLNGAAAIPVTIFQYRDIASGDPQDSTPLPDSSEVQSELSAESCAEVKLSEAEVVSRIGLEREQAVREAEQRIRREYEEKLALAHSSLINTLRTFNEQRHEYFTRVEGEVVQLSLAIAAKILHREAQVDPMLVAALVKIAIQKLREGSSVTLRVSPCRVASWKAYFSEISQFSRVEIVAASEIGEFDCQVETELGSTSIGIDRQLKEIEQGFFDLLALRPSSS